MISANQSDAINLRTIKAVTLTSSVSRDAGGLFWSVRALCDSLIKNGVELQVFGGVDEHAYLDRQSWDKVPLTILPIHGPKAFGYQIGLLGRLKRVQPDLLHVHGLWTYPSLAALKWSKRRKPYLISPHGMLDPWAVRNSALKKKIAAIFYSNAFLQGATCLHALNDAEREAIRAYGLKNPIAVIPNGIDLPDRSTVPIKPEWEACLPSRSKVLISLCRLHPKKGLMNLLEAWAKARQRRISGAEEWQLVIAGWDQGGHLSELERRTYELGLVNSVHFIGPQFNDSKLASLIRADAFVLPSFSEGLPMSVLEAWSCGLPVIMTPQCNLPEGFSAEAAIRVDPEVDSLVAGLARLFGMSDEERRSIGERGLTLVKRDFLWSKAGAQMHDVYRWLLGQGSRPNCIRLD